MTLWRSFRRFVGATLRRMGVLKLHPYMGDYLQQPFVRALRDVRIESIFEFGAADGQDTLRLRDHFGAVVHAFECNPLMLPALRARLSGEPRVHLVERAVWDADGPIPFFPVVHTEWGGRITENAGASSCFRTVSGYHQQYTHTEVTVDATRLDSYCTRENIGAPNLLCIDAQGAALKSLRGLGSYLADVRAIIIEIEHREIFIGEDLYPAVDAFLRGAGFHQTVVIEHDGWYNNYLYLRDITPNR